LGTRHRECDAAACSGREGARLRGGVNIDWHQVVREMFNQGKELDEIAKRVQRDYFPDWSIKKLKDYRVRPYYNRLKDKPIQEAKDKILAENDKRLCERLIRERAQKDIIADKMVSAIKALPKLDIQPLKINLKPSAAEEEIVLMLSDIQAGTYISKEATGGLNEYSWDTLEQQFKNLLSAMVSIIGRHKKIAPIRKLNIHMLGDMIEGMDIFIGQAQHVDQDLYNQMFKLAELICWLVVELLHLFEEIEISAIGGNHGRVGKKGENPHYVNWDVYLYKYCEARTQNYDRIKWNIPLSWWYLDKIQGFNFLLLHGDDIKAWQGIPYYGIDRADAKWTQLLASRKMSYDFMELGHFHSQGEIPGVASKKFINGCWPGGSIFALKSLTTSSDPSQMMFAVHPERGVTYRYSIAL
jgi:hypothetical protein